MISTNSCRVCGGSISPFLDLGKQCLHNVFPKPSEPEPAHYPIVVCRCQKCGCVQLQDEVPPKELYANYYYRSGLNDTMKFHISWLASEAMDLLGKREGSALDIACNDLTLLKCMPDAFTRVGIDPSDVTKNTPAQSGITVINGYFPNDMMLGRAKPFDLIFTVAMFYDTPNPIAFAKAVKKLLAPDGLWCVEVAYLPDVFRHLSYDYFCLEHLMLYRIADLQNIAGAAGLRAVHARKNGSNGGSVRVYFTHGPERPIQMLGDKAGWKIPDAVSTREHPFKEEMVRNWHEHFFSSAEACKDFADAVKRHADRLHCTLLDLKKAGKRVHLLGASTKTNVVLQYAGIDSELIQAASERDEAKYGRYTPGTGIPIIPESNSRALEPDVYATLLPFKEEILKREEAFLARGGQFLWVLPKCELTGKN